MAEAKATTGHGARALRGVVFQSRTRAERFLEKLEEKGVGCTVLSFDDPEWLEFDYSTIDIVVFYPSFLYSSNHPQAMYQVADNLQYLATRYPRIQFYPDPSLIHFYNDKYRQFLFLEGNGFPIPHTIPLWSETSLQRAEEQLGYPMILKNRYGASGFYVFRVRNRKELRKYFRISTLDLFDFPVLVHLLRAGLKRLSLYSLIKMRKARFPLLSPPLLAQKFIEIDRDLKTVCRDAEIVEGHWRLPARDGDWKMNIDAGGAGEWSHIPDEAKDLSIRLAKALRARWLNIDLLRSRNRFLVSEFSPVWHHYAFGEKENFVYRDDYNAVLPLEEGLDLEEIITSHLLERAKNAE